MLHAANNSIKAISTPTSYAYYTDGSVDSNTESAGAAFFSANATGLWKLPAHCSSAQTELYAIKKALEHANTTHGANTVIIHSDSKTAI